MNEQITNTLAERNVTHGSFAHNAAASQALKETIANHQAHVLTDVHHEALDNICQKIARIICGDPNHSDSWHDIAGYATLGERGCNGTD